MDGSEIVRISVLSVVAGLFIIFILLDACKAYIRKAHWVPSHYLVLSALIIQLLSLMSVKSALSEDALQDPRKNDFWMIHSSRVMLCVVMAYLVPSMAARGSQEFWGKLGALGITIILQMTSELYRVHSNGGKSPSSSESLGELAFALSVAVISISFVTLIVLLACANIASRGIQVIFAQKIPLILSTANDARVKEYKWQEVEDEVLKAWIITRAYTPEYIIARSALSCSAAAIITLLICSSIIGWGIQGFPIISSTPSDKAKLTVTVLQVIFILVGWAIIGWRWAIAAGYYTRWHSSTWRTVCRVEDYWTRHIEDLIDGRGPKLVQAKRLDKSVRNLIAQQPPRNPIPRMFLFMLAGLQWATVLVSKICWVFSLIVFHNKCTAKLSAFILSKHVENEFEKFSNYEKILKGLDMLGETPKSLWIANKTSIAKAKKLITDGKQDGKTSCEDLITFLQRRNDNVRPEGIDLSTVYSKSPRGLKYLWKAPANEYVPLDAEKQFVEANITSWKMTVVSLIKIIIELSPIYASSECPGTCEATSHEFPPKEVKDSLKAYTQAWEILDFLDTMEAGGIIGEAADTYFLQLRTKVEKMDFSSNIIFHSNPECVTAAINDIAKEGKENADKPRGFNIIFDLVDKLGLKSKTEKPKHGSEDEELVHQEFVGAYDSMNWKKVAAGTAVHKLCKCIAEKPNAKELFNELQCALADIIYGSLTKAKYMLVVNSGRWARVSDESKIARALYVAGKAKALMKMEKREREKGNPHKKDKGGDSMAIVPSHIAQGETNPPTMEIAASGLEIVSSNL